MFSSRAGFAFILLVSAAASSADGYFEGFSNAVEGWSFMAGDGNARMTFSQSDGAGRIELDARADQHNIWWAFIRRSVSAEIDRNALAQSDRELRVEARIRISHAPRRVNLHFNHSRTTDFHSHLMEFDIPDATNWHTISFTTNGFDALPADEVFVQMALMDWGRSRYAVEVDYIKVDVVDSSVSGPDLGEPLPYRPPAPALDTFSLALAPVEVAVVDRESPRAESRTVRQSLAVGGPLISILRWDLAEIEDCTPDGWGVLALTTTDAETGDDAPEEFERMRVVEILGGDPGWRADTVTLDSFLAGAAIDTVLNEQMIVDVLPAQASGSETRIPISPPVLRRLLRGQTLGLALYGQGDIRASFAAEPQLFLNVMQPGEGCREPVQ